MLDSNFMFLMVDHVTRVVVVGGFDKPITFISLGKSTNTTFNASIFGIVGVFSSRSIGVDFLNVPNIATSLKV